MRGHKPHLIRLSEADRMELQIIIKSGKTEQRVARRARVLLSMGNPQTRVVELAKHHEITRATIWKLCCRYGERGIEAIYDAPRSGRPRVFSPLGQGSDRATRMLRASRHRIGNDPLVNKELGEDSGRTGRGIVPKIAHSTVSLILKTADLQPHRSRYWKTPTLNAGFRRRASRILWCYENVDKLYDMGAVIICLDEKPNIQALERRCPTKLVAPGMIERREFEYIHHGTVNFVAALIVHDGQMRRWCLDKNDSEHLRPVLVELLDEFKDSRRVYLIWDGGPSHRATKTKELLKGYGKLVRVFMTPAHASWLDQAELLLRAFSERYLKHGDWESKQHLIDHLEAGWRGYNRLYAHPFSWS